MKKYKVAVVGATGTVGREILGLLAEREFPIDEIYALASSKSHGKDISFGDNIVKAQNIESFDFSGTDIALFSAGSYVSEKYGKKAAAAGCVVIDNGSFHRLKENVPLIVPEVNYDRIREHKNIIANPNCNAIPLAMVLNILGSASAIKRVVVSTYQSVSGAGKGGMDELFHQTKGYYINDRKDPEFFPKQIAFNIIPKIDELLPNGNTKEEEKIINEVQKILEDNIPISVTSVRVPVFVGHSMSVNVEFDEELSPEDAKKLFEKSPGIALINDKRSGDIITPFEIVRRDEVFISRVRKDSSVPFGLNLWVVSDNLRKGAALNAVQIAEKLIAH